MRRFLLSVFALAIGITTIFAPVASAADFFQVKNGNTTITYYNLTNSNNNANSNTQSTANTTRMPNTKATAKTVSTTKPVTSKPNTLNGSNMMYVALGDSVAAGAGLGGTNSGPPCVRTQQAYPNIVAQKRNLQLNHIACSGATAGDLVTKQGVSGPNVRAQLDQAFANGTPALITITAGANDVAYVQFVAKCYRQTCGSSSDTAATATLRAAMEVKYRFELSEIHRRSNGPPPQVVVTGYYNPISNFCKGKQTFATNEEINWLNSERDKLNKSIRSSIKDYKCVRV